MRYAIVIPAGFLQNASDVWHVLDPDFGGADTFTVPLSADGNAPASHYAAYGPLEAATVSALQDTNTNFQAYLDGLAVERGRVAPATVGFKNAMSLSEGDANFNTFIDGLGLQEVAVQI